MEGIATAVSTKDIRRLSLRKGLLDLRIANAVETEGISVRRKGLRKFVRWSIELRSAILENWIQFYTGCDPLDCFRCR